MSHKLISWIARNNDFISPPKGQVGIAEQVNPNGPTLNFHRHHWQQEEHLMLYGSEADEPRAEFLANAIQQEFPGRNVSTRLVAIQNILNLQEVKAKVERLLLQEREHQIDIFFSPGAPMMQLSWYICHTTLGLSTRLLQLNKAEFSPEGHPELIEMQVAYDPAPGNAIIRQLSQNGPPSEHYLFTPSLKQVYHKAELAAQADDARVLIYGDSGSGKEHLAQFIHRHSPRHGKAFQSVNCAALPDTLLASTLFGHVKGAFTDAHQDKKGLFESCEGGTLFLDEIGDISERMQASLLRVLETGEILPVGSTRSRQVNVRIIAATNRDLAERSKAGYFRWDLYYRLEVVTLELPTLYERGPVEVAALIDFFLVQKQQTYRRSKPLRLTQEVRSYLEKYPWPGNVRELANVIESFYVFCQEEVSWPDLPKRLRENTQSASEHWKDVEAEHLRKLYRRYDGNITQIGRAGGYRSRNTVRDKLREYGVLEE